MAWADASPAAAAIATARENTHHWTAVMTSLRRLSSALTLAAFGSAAALGSIPLPEKPGFVVTSPLRVMSFNVRNSNAQDGDNSWPHRIDLLFETIGRFGPDLIGFQEVRENQHDERQKNEASFNGFKPGAVIGSRIDFVFHTADFKPLSAEIDRFTGEGGRLPSDHYPVNAILDWPRAAR